MARSLTRPQLAARFAVIAPVAAFLAAACGGFDTLSDGDASTDASAEGSVVDAASADGTTGNDGQGDAPTDTSLVDQFVSEASDATAAMDARETSDAGAAADAAMDARDASDASEAGDATDAMDATDASDAMDATDASDAEAGLDAGLIRDPRLGTLSRFAAFAGSTVTNVALTTITGDVGTFPSTTAIGTTMPVLVGSSAFQLGNTIAQIAATDLVTAYDGLTPASMPGCTVLTGMDLGGLTLPAGIYCFSTSAQLTGALVLDARNNPNAEWFFQIGSTLTTGPIGATAATVTVINGGNPCNVFWQVGSSATLGTATAFSGNILAMASVTLVTGTTLLGRALAETGAVTLDTNTVSIAACP